MIPFLIYLLVKKYGKQYWPGQGLQISKSLATRLQIILVSVIILLLTLIPVLSRSQSRLSNYRIIRGMDDIGWLRLEKKIEGSQSTLLLVSEIKTRILFQITVSSKESSVFENSKLIYSSQFRQTNGTTKLDKETRLVADKYQVLENGEKEDLGIAFIGTNLLSLYFQEPVGIDEVYCDNHQCFTKVTRTDDGGYKVKFPNGDSNCYYYNGGTCILVKVNHTLYSATIILVP